MTLSKEQKKEMFWMMVLSRRLDERAWVPLRQGKIAFYISGFGQETAQFGAVYALKQGKDWLVLYYRDLAMMLVMGMKPTEFAMSLMGKAAEPTSGARQMLSHFGLRRARVATESPYPKGGGRGLPGLYRAGGAAWLRSPELKPSARRWTRSWPATPTPS